LRVVENRVGPDGRCPDCGAPLAGVGMAAVVESKLRTTAGGGILLLIAHRFVMERCL